MSEFNMFWIYTESYGNMGNHAVCVFASNV